MITVTTTHHAIKFNIKRLKGCAKLVLGLLDYPDYELNILLTNNKKIQSYNQKYRNIDKPTDILSFSFYPDLKPGERIQPEIEDDKHLGDIIISLEYVEEQLKKFDVTMDDRLSVLLVHGICHLLGYDHETDEQFEQMKKEEDRLLKHISEHLENHQY